MKKLILNLSLVACLTVAVSACNSTKNVSGDADSTMMDTSMTPVDTGMSVPADTTKLPPDTTVKPIQ